MSYKRTNSQGAKLARAALARRAGVSLVEILIALAIVGVIVSLALVGIQSAREASRRTACQANLHGLGAALQQFHAAHNMFPPGCRQGLSSHVFLLPYLEQRALFEKFDIAAGTSSPQNQDLARSLPHLNCPSDGAGEGRKWAPTNYAGNCGTGVQAHGYNGLFRYYDTDLVTFQTGPFVVRSADVRDGLSNTVAYGEILTSDGTDRDFRRAIFTGPKTTPIQDIDLFAHTCDTFNNTQPADLISRGTPWIDGNLMMSMYNHVLGPNRRNCTFGGDVQRGAYSAASEHPGGANVVFADGHAAFIANSIELPAWRAMGARNDVDIE